MYITRRRSPVKKKLIQEKLKRNIATNTCPACQGSMEIIESKEDSDVYVCKKCHATNTFAKHSSYVANKSKELQLTAFKLVDKSKDKKYDYRNKEQKPKEIASDALAVIRKAMTEKKLLQFDYPRERDLITRVTEPYKLAFDGSKNLILWAYCTEAEGIRMFKVEKIKNLQVKEYTYTPRWGMEDKVANDEDSKNKKG